MSRTAIKLSNHQPPVDRILLGVGLMLVFCVVAPLIDVASKIAVQMFDPAMW